LVDAEPAGQSGPAAASWRVRRIRPCRLLIADVFHMASGRGSGAHKTSPGGSRRNPKGSPATGRVSEQEIEDVEERSSPRTPVIYEIVRRLGEEEMARPITSLWWSGVAAGLSISFSLLAQALLEMHLADAPWRPLVSSFGYSVGFLMAVLSRQQLFTETTITAVLPVMAKFTVANVARMGRMWSIVLLANLAGTLFAAVFCTFAPVISPELRESMLQISRHVAETGWVEMFFLAIAAGFLMAAMVWLLPSADGAQFHVITMMTWLIALGGFTHIVAGSTEAFLLVVNGQMSVGTMLAGFMAPVLAGNIVGGTVLFAVLSYAQVMEEI
jgi:formate-nitrite transporter family protein